MDFVKLTDEEAGAVKALGELRGVLARAELMASLARIRLAFADRAEDEVSCDPWFRDQDETVRVAVMSSIAETRAAELSRLSEAQVWLRDAPARIEALRGLLAGQETADG